MTDKTQDARDEINACLRILRLRAVAGAKAKPTVKELNEILNRLEFASNMLSEG